MIAFEINPRLGHEGRQSRNEIYWFDGHLRGAIPVGGLQGIENLAVETQRKAENCHCSSDKLPTQLLTIVLLMSFTAHPGVPGSVPRAG